MNGGMVDAASPALRRTSRTSDSTVSRVGRLVSRTAVILLVAAAVVLGASAIGYSPLASRLPGTFLPFGGDHGGPPPAVERGGPAATAQQGRGSQESRGRGSPSGAGQEAGARDAGPNRSDAGPFTGRNAPSVQSGVRQEMPYLALFAAITAAIAVALHPRRSHRRRSTDLRPLSARLLGL